MKKILFLIPNTNFSFIFLFKIFSKYEQINKNKSLLYNETHPYSKKNDDINIVDVEWSFNYKKNSIDIIISDLENLNNSYKTKYDDIIVFESKHEFHEIEYPKDIKYIFLAIDELPYPTENIEISIEEGTKMISSSNIYIKNKFLKGYFYEYKLSFLFYYYHLGLYHLSLEKIYSIKKNILGFYHRSDYKEDRDELVNNILKIFKNKNNNLLKNYSLPYDNDFATLMDLRFYNGWRKNHISSYTDYINSICVLIFESDCPMGTFHPTEKIVKSLMFSKLDIPSILYCNDNLMIELYKDGFWFLNFEFIDFNTFIKVDSKHRLNLIHNSIQKSIEFLLSTVEENNNDLEKSNKDIQNMFSHKMQNNYKIFKETISDIKIQDKMMDFILDINQKNII